MKMTESHLKLLIKSIILEVFGNKPAYDASKLKKMSSQQKRAVELLIKKSFEIKSIYDTPQGTIGVVLERGYGKGSQGRMSGVKVADVKPDGTINSEGIDIDTYVGRVGEKIEPVIQKTPNQNHEFDDGRYSVMKAVNVGESVEEKVGPDGKYQDDMESGVKSNKMMGMTEVNSGPTDLFIEETVESGHDFSYNIIWRGKNGEWNEAFNVLKTHTSNNRLELWSKAHAESPKGFAPLAFRDKHSRQIMIGNTLKMLANMRDKEATTAIKEESGTGAVGGYSTPFAFSRNKLGSGKAIAAAKKYGKVVKSISEKEQK